jgi:hypothetical protein
MPDSRAPRTAIFTICARNYLAYALTLRESLRGAAPEHAFFIFLADGQLEAGQAGPAPEGLAAETIPLDALGLPDPEGMTFRYSVLELATSIKPFCFRHLFDTLGFDRAVYFDPDIEVFAWPDEVTAAFDAGAACALTPHICSPYTDAARPGILDILQSGTFNLGFAAFANVPEARAFLDWWAERLATDCFVDLPRGLFVDQRYVDLAPSFMPSLKVLHSKGLNVAYWNLHERPLVHEGRHWTAGGEPLRFFHFSGVIPGNPGVFSKYQDRFSVDESGPVSQLLEAYLERLASNGHDHWSKIPYAFSLYRTGAPIPAPARRRPFPAGSDPFARHDHGYWDAPSERFDAGDGTVITRMMHAIHAARPDLQASFPLTTRAGRAGFADWFRAYAASEYGLPPAPKAARLFARAKLSAGRLLGQWRGRNRA